MTRSNRWLNSQSVSSASKISTWSRYATGAMLLRYVEQPDVRAPPRARGPGGSGGDAQRVLNLLEHCLVGLGWDDGGRRRAGRRKRTFHAVAVDRRRVTSGHHGGLQRRDAIDGRLELGV